MILSTAKHILKVCAMLFCIVGFSQSAAFAAESGVSQPITPVTEDARAVESGDSKSGADNAGTLKKAAPQKRKNLVPGPAITPTAWPGGTSIPTGTLAIVDHVTYSHGEPRKYTSSHTDRNPKGNKAGPRSNELLNNVFKLRYGLAWNRLDIRTSTPFVHNDIQRHSNSGTWKGGIADTTVMLRYQVMPRTDEVPFNIALDAGVIVPTGQVGNPDKYLATNAFGVVLGGGASWINNDQRFDVDARYVMYTEGANNITPGNYYLSHAHYAYALSRYFDLGAETWLRVEEARKISGVGQKDSFTECYAGPKFQVKVPEWSNFMVGAAVLLPVYRYYENTKLSADARFEFRTGVSF